MTKKAPFCGCAENEPTSGGVCLNGTYYALLNDNSGYIAITFQFVVGDQNQSSSYSTDQYASNAFDWYYKTYPKGFGTPFSSTTSPGTILDQTTYTNCKILANDSSCPFQGLPDDNCSDPYIGAYVCGQYVAPSPSISAAQLSSNYNMVTLSNANYPCKRYFGNNVSNQLYPGNYLLMK
jgi:hypothetical protein